MVPGAAPLAQLGPTESDFLTACSARHNSVPDYPAVQAAAAAILATYSARQAGSTAQDALWSFASGLATRTLFGPFKIDPRTGAQVGHQAVLVRWSAGTLAVS